MEISYVEWLQMDTELFVIGHLLLYCLVKTDSSSVNETMLDFS